MHCIWFGVLFVNYSGRIVDLWILWRKMKYWPILNLLNLELRVCLGGGEIWIQIRCQHHKVKCWATTSYLCPKSKSLKKLKTLLTSSLDPIHRQSSHRRPSCYPKCWQENGGLETRLWKLKLTSCCCSECRARCSLHSRLPSHSIPWQYLFDWFYKFDLHLIALKKFLSLLCMYLYRKHFFDQ